MAKKKKSRFGANVGGNVQRQKAQAKGFGYLNLPKGIKMFKEKVGRSHFDIIPYYVTAEKHSDRDPDDPTTAHVGNPWYRRPVLVHHGVGAENESVVCPKTIGKKCPICEEREKQLKSGVDWKDAISKPSQRNLYVVVPIKNKEFEEEMHVWDISQFNFQEELNKELEENPDYWRFPDPETGLTLNVRFSEETFAGQKFPQASRVDFDDREPYPESIMDDAPNLDEVFTVFSYKEISQKFFEMEEDDYYADDPEETDAQEEEPEEEKKSLRSRKPKSLRDKKEKSEEDEEDKEEAPPTRRRKTEDKPERKRKTKEEDCPEGHEFAKDWDEYDDCDDCEVFEACSQANKELE